jgi:hypothetical protein
MSVPIFWLHYVHSSEVHENIIFKGSGIYEASMYGWVRNEGITGQTVHTVQKIKCTGVGDGTYDSNISAKVM